MIEYRLKSGDLLLVEGTTSAVLLRETLKYWYYFYKNRESRISKTKLWKYIDTGRILVSMGSKKYRRKKRKQRTLDLHGIKHDSVDEVLRQFLNFVDLPCEVITGNSNRMRAIVQSVAEEYGWKVNHLTGKIIIHE